MRNRERITRLTIASALGGKFMHKKDACNCKILYHFTSKIPVVDNSANIFMSIVTKDIPGFIDSNINREHTVIKRTFNLLFTQCHLTMISQNFSECKQYLAPQKNLWVKQCLNSGKTFSSKCVTVF